MRFKDYSRWIWNEIKETKTFTALNLVGIWIGVWVVIIFLSLALGVEEATINRITEDIDLFTLEVDPKNENLQLSFTDFYMLETDPRVKQIVPVLIEYVRIGDHDVLHDPAQIEGQALIAYTENYFAQDTTNIDSRTDALSFIEGRRLTSTDSSGIIVSEATLKNLQSVIPSLTRDNYEQHRIDIVVKRFDSSGQEEYRNLESYIVGIVETTPYNGVLVYISSSLAEQIDDWLKFRQYQPMDYRNRQYERFDIVTYNLDDLESVREDLQDNDYPTHSILDRIDNVRQVLLVIKVVFFLIFGIAILIAGFNIVITLTSAVLKRKHEIGILKSLGATDVQVQNIFVLHALYLSAFGSVIGAITAYIIIGLARIILSSFEILEGIELFRTNVLGVIVIVILAIALSMVASLAPASRAAAITPIETLREN